MLDDQARELLARLKNPEDYHEDILKHVGYYFILPLATSIFRSKAYQSIKKDPLLMNALKELGVFFLCRLTGREKVLSDATLVIINNLEAMNISYEHTGIEHSDARYFNAKPNLRKLHEINDKYLKIDDTESIEGKSEALNKFFNSLILVNKPYIYQCILLIILQALKGFRLADAQELFDAARTAKKDDINLASRTIDLLNEIDDFQKNPQLIRERQAGNFIFGHIVKFKLLNDQTLPEFESLWKKKYKNFSLNQSTISVIKELIQIYYINRSSQKIESFIFLANEDSEGRNELDRLISGEQDIYIHNLKQYITSQANIDTINLIIKKLDENLIFLANHHEEICNEINILKNFTLSPEIKEFPEIVALITPIIRKYQNSCVQIKASIETFKQLKNKYLAIFVALKNSLPIPVFITKATQEIEEQWNQITNCYNDIDSIKQSHLLDLEEWLNTCRTEINNLNCATKKIDIHTYRIFSKAEFYLEMNFKIIELLRDINNELENSICKINELRTQSESVAPSFPLLRLLNEYLTELLEEREIDAQGIENEAEKTITLAKEIKSFTELFEGIEKNFKENDKTAESEVVKSTSITYNNNPADTVSREKRLADALPAGMWQRAKWPKYDDEQQKSATYSP